MAQQIIVCIIGVAVAVYLVVALWRLVTRRADPCSGCAGCDVRRELDSRVEECREKHKKGDRLPGNSSCGCGE